MNALQVRGDERYYSLLGRLLCISNVNHRRKAEPDAIQRSAPESVANGRESRQKDFKSLQ